MRVPLPAPLANSLRDFTRSYFAHRYAILFFSLLLTLGVGPFLGLLPGEADLLAPFLALNLLIAVIGDGGRQPRHFARLVVLAVIGVHLVAAWAGADRISIVTLFLWTPLALIAVVRAMRFALRAPVVDAERVYAALSAYMLAGLFFGVLYWIVEQAVPGSLVDGSVELGTPLPLEVAVYFSFVTIATLGYGDVVPRGDLARGIAILEAVAAQLYLAVLVARLVSLYVRNPGDRSGR